MGEEGEGEGAAEGEGEGEGAAEGEGEGPAEGEGEGVAEGEGEGEGPGDLPICIARARMESVPDFEAFPDDASPLVTVPLPEVLLQAVTGETAPDAVSFQWSTLEVPTGSRSVFTPDSTAAEPRYRLDLAGHYGFELRVSRRVGVTSKCRVWVEARPREDLYVELVWDTPGDRDQTDDRGTDLDLHLLDARGAWFCPEWDCWSGNMNPDWGDAGDELDDPRLFWNDTDGAGPEMIWIDGLPGQAKLRLGVHQVDDGGIGRSDALVRVHMQGKLAWESERRALRDVDGFAEVGVIDWANRKVEPVHTYVVPAPRGPCDGTDPVPG